MLRKTAATLILAAVIAVSVPRAALAQNALSQFKSASADSIASSIVNRAVPGGEALTSGNGGLRQPSDVQIELREEVAADLTAIKHGTVSAQPVHSAQQVALIEKRADQLAVAIRRNGPTSALMARYADVVAPLFVYQRDLSVPRRLRELNSGRPAQIYPGEELAFSYNGYCADQNLPAPSAAEPVSLVTMDAIFPKEVQGVAGDVARYGAMRSDYPGQAIIWFMRSLGGDVDLSNYQYLAGEIELAKPGDWNIVSNWQADQARRAARKRLFGQLASLVLSQTGIGAQTNSLLGTAQSLMTVVQGSTPGQIATFVSSRMSVLRNAPIQGEKPADLSALSRLDGLDVVGEANHLTVDALVYNAKPYPVTFDPSSVLIAQAERPTQRSVGPPGRFHFPGDAVADPHLATRVSATIKHSLANLRNSSAASAISAVSAARMNACQSVGAMQATGGFGHWIGGGWASDAADVLNSYRAAATGYQVDGTAASPIQQAEDVLLTGGSIDAALAAAPGATKRAGITSGMSTDSALAAIVDEGAFIAVGDVSLQGKPDLGKDCDYIANIGAQKTVLNWSSTAPPNSDSWRQLASQLQSSFRGRHDQIASPAAAQNH